MKHSFMHSFCVIILAALTLALSACAPAAPVAPAAPAQAAPASAAPVQEAPAAAEQPPATAEAPSTYSPNAGALIGVTLYSRRSQQQLDLEAGIRDMAATLGFSIILEDADTDAARQVEQINSFVEKGVSAILIDTTTDDTVKSAVAAAKAAGIPVVSVTVAATGADAHLGFSYTEDGAALADWFANYVNTVMGGSAKLGVIDYASCKLICQPKLAAFEEKLAAACPGAEIIAKYDGKGKRNESMTACEKLLMKNPDVDAILVLNEEAADAAATIVADMKAENVKIIGSAYGDNLFDALASGSSPYIALAADPYYTLGGEALKAADKLLSGESVAAQTPYAAMLLTPDNIGEYDYSAIAAKRAG